MHENVAVGLRAAQLLADHVKLIAEQVEELGPVLLAEVRVVVVLNKNRQKLLQLHLGSVRVLFERVKSEVGKIHVAFLLMLLPLP